MKQLKEFLKSQEVPAARMAKCVEKSDLVELALGLLECFGDWEARWRPPVSRTGARWRDVAGPVVGARALQSVPPLAEVVVTVFLDVDGVLNQLTGGFAKSLSRDSCVVFLRDLLAKLSQGSVPSARGVSLDYQIVLSSSWRSKLVSKRALLDFLAEVEAGLPEAGEGDVRSRFVGQTPSISFERRDEEIAAYLRERGMATIEPFLDGGSADQGLALPPVMLVLDDMYHGQSWAEVDQRRAAAATTATAPPASVSSPLLQAVRDAFVHVDPRTGLTPADADCALDSVDRQLQRVKEVIQAMRAASTPECL